MDIDRDTSHLTLIINSILKKKKTNLFVGIFLFLLIQHCKYVFTFLKQPHCVWICHNLFNQFLLMNITVFFYFGFTDTTV